MSPKSDEEKPVAAKPVSSRPSQVKNATLDIPTYDARSSDLFATAEEVVEYLRLCYYGPEGSAKTTNALTMANQGKVLLINAEGGMKKETLRRRGINVDNIMVWPPRSTDPITAQGLEAVFQRLKSDLMMDENAWEGIVVDSSTDVTQALTALVSSDRITKSRNRGNLVDDIDEYFTDQADYGTMTKMFIDKMRKFRDLPLHVVYTALERRSVDKNTSEVTVGPAVTPAVATGLLGYVDIVIHCTAGDDERPFRGLTRPRGKYRAKDRFDVLPVVMVEPTVDRVVAYINGELQEATDEKQSLLPKELPAGRKSGKKKKPEASAQGDDNDDESENESDNDAETQ